MEKRPYSKSLRGKITNRTLFIGIVPVLLVGVFAWFSLNQLTSSANQQLDKSRSELLDSVVGSNLSTTSARIVSQLDAFMLERISDVVVWASAPIIIQAAKAAAEAHQKVGLVDQSIDEIEARFKKRKSLNVSPAANRFLIERPVYENFCARFAKRTAALTVGPGLDDPDIGPLMNPGAVAKQVSHVEDALTKGARLLTGGEGHEAGPLFYKPTVLADVPADALIFHTDPYF